MSSPHLLFSSPTHAHLLHHPFRHFDPHPSPLFGVRAYRRNRIHRAHQDDLNNESIDSGLLESGSLLETENQKMHDQRSPESDQYEDEDVGELLDDRDQQASGEDDEDELREDEDRSEDDLAEQVTMGEFSPTLDLSFAGSFSITTAPTPSPNRQGPRFTHHVQLSPVSAKSSFPPAHLFAPTPNAMAPSSSPYRMDISPASASTRCNIPSYSHQAHSSPDPFSQGPSRPKSHTLLKVSPTTSETRRTMGLKKVQSRPKLSSESSFLHPSRTTDPQSSPSNLDRTSDCMDIDSPSYAQPPHCDSLSSQMRLDDQSMDTACLYQPKSRSTSQSSNGKRSRSDEDEDHSLRLSNSGRKGRKSGTRSSPSSPLVSLLPGPSQADRIIDARRYGGKPSRCFSPFQMPSSPNDTSSPSVKAAAKMNVGRKTSERPLSSFCFPASKSHIPSITIPPVTRSHSHVPGSVEPAFGDGPAYRRPVLGVVQSSATLFSRHQSTSITSPSMNRKRDAFGRPASKIRRAISFAATQGDNVHLMLQGDGMAADPDEDDEESELDISLVFDGSPAARISHNASHHLLVSSTWSQYTESPIRPSRSKSHNGSNINPVGKLSLAGPSTSIPTTFNITMATQSPARTSVATLGSTVESPVGMAFSEKERAGKILPCHKVSNDGLMRISADTMDQFLEGLYDDKISEKIVVDCRFGYEYQGGHIRTAINIQDKEVVDKVFLQGEIFAGGSSDVPSPSVSGKVDTTGQRKKVVVVFHCEYSAKRAPTVAKYLREQDRHINMTHYPALHYPEIYILEGGYAKYHAHSPQHCIGTYVGMDDPSHRSDRHVDLNQFRTRESAFASRAKSFTYGENQKLLKTGSQQKKPVFLLGQSRSEAHKPRVIFE
ncbi:hypothetical protein PSTG_04610 [Puccinia striiformis f. sp. tritici PST-78]|uniref:M-phase inducer phosphatase n=1 Tax=Puccinia striiformis f. sp. tritici PST-78 TaxID=1165861 RepID=A0A0L0VSD0_9BASI|nr:hypothetical protein PSTG_04610 [Puccinia striiformis f. sp. tritici PST-78]